MYGCMFVGFVSVHSAKWEVKLAMAACVKGLCQCTVQAVYISLSVVCVKGLCLHSASCVLGSLCERFAQCKLCAWSFL